jgi:hypothetical protein
MALFNSDVPASKLLATRQKIPKKYTLSFKPPPAPPHAKIKTEAKASQVGLEPTAFGYPKAQCAIEVQRATIAPLRLKESQWDYGTSGEFLSYDQYIVLRED